jgi:hypothetical protein
VHVKTYFTRSHHHTTTDSIQRIRADTGTSGDDPTESKGGQEVSFKRSNENNRLDGIVHSKVQTTVDDDSKDGWSETTVKTSDTISGKSLLVDIYQTVELTLTTLLGGLGIVGKTSTGIIERIDEEKRGGTSSLAVGSAGS